MASFSISNKLPPPNDVSDFAGRNNTWLLEYRTLSEDGKIKDAVNFLAFSRFVVEI